MCEIFARVSVHTHTRTRIPSRSRTIGKKRSVRVIYWGFRTRDLWWTQKCLGPEDILSETHTVRIEERATYTYILAVGLIPVGDKTTSSIWCVCKNKGSSESSCRRRSAVLRVITRIDLVASSIYIENVSRGRCLVAAGGAKNPPTRARAAIGVGTKTRRWWSKDHLSFALPGGFRVTWLEEFVDIAVIAPSAQWCPRDIRLIIYP